MLNYPDIFRYLDSTLLPLNSEFHSVDARRVAIFLVPFDNGTPFGELMEAMAFRGVQNRLPLCDPKCNGLAQFSSSQYQYWRHLQC